MTRPRVIVCLWIACAFVAWHVIFDQLVWSAATEFTREQIRNYQSGQPLISIHAGFSPRVTAAAWQALVWTLPIVAVAAVSVYFSFRQVR
jgi:hypothetical protein